MNNPWKVIDKMRNYGYEQFRVVKDPGDGMWCVHGTGDTVPDQMGRGGTIEEALKNMHPESATIDIRNEIFALMESLNCEFSVEGGIVTVTTEEGDKWDFTEPMLKAD